MEDLASGFGAPSVSGWPGPCCSQIRPAWGGEGRGGGGGCWSDVGNHPFTHD